MTTPLPDTRIAEKDMQQPFSMLIEDAEPPEWFREAVALPPVQPAEASAAALIADLTFMRETHVGWAEHFEHDPEIEAKYVATGEWDDAKEHRRCIDVYDRAIAVLNSIPDQIARAVEVERAKWTPTGEYYLDQLVLNGFEIEREACASLIERMAPNEGYAAAIRARGAKP